MQNISLELNDGSSLALLGPNGSGKTTLIKSVLGLVKPTTGNLFYQGNKTTTHELKNVIGYMPQIGQYPENMKIKNLIELMLAIRNCT
ncbi:MAG: ATP-binding cassette domain-containing protein, partial [Bacteroidetes bacterium]|nr:ATP-binding cassette domain-containing protein [Bacteroidota bacterium]